MHTVSKRLYSHFKPLLGLLALLITTSTANAWWNDEWALRRALTVDASTFGSPADANEKARPVLVRLHDGNFQFQQAMENGADLRFIAADDKTSLTYHIDRYDSVLNEAFVWVDVPGLKPGAKVDLWLYYSHTKRTAPQASDSKASYDTGTALVYHFSGDGAPSDATRNANNASNVATAVQGSLIGPGLRLAGSPVRIPESATLRREASQPLAISAWAKPNAVTGNTVLLSWGTSAAGIELGLAAGVPYFEIRNAGAAQRTPAGAALAADAWKNIAVVSSASASVLYVDGVEYSRVAGALPALAGEIVLGANAEGKNGFVGELDEVEISTVARSVGWLKLSVASEAGSAASQKFLVFGAEEAAGGGGHNATFEHVMLFGDIAKNMMFDGWIAVGICVIMMAIGWVVALKKFAYLKRIEQGSAEFLRQWQQVSTDLTVLDHADANNVKSLGGNAPESAQQSLMQQSPLYHIYHIGSEEIRHRLQSKRGFNGLSGRSITAIKASLDAGLTREVHRLNSGLVSLTIGIAGGPYVGLMGTVVGVMITFAVIAKTGEVEVNSIAPGIASALLATVFGLLVAIPALFLYSFLNSRIKNAISDMQLFIDEFITKMAEFYPTPADAPAPQARDVEDDLKKARKA